MAGGGFLVYLGLRGLWTLYTQWDTPVVAPGVARLGSPHHSLREGFAVNMLSPVILTFYLAVVPTFIRPTWPPAAYWLLAAVHVSTALACHSAWVLALHRMRPIVTRERPRRALALAASGAMLGLAARVLLR
jgi:threonine/homoserine/homoserine lactone efflux protein